MMAVLAAADAAEAFCDRMGALVLSQRLGAHADFRRVKPKRFIKPVVE
jgi:hypothetical protein